MKPEERNRILENARKLVPGPTGAPLTDPTLAAAAFPSTHPDWDYNTAEATKEQTLTWDSQRQAAFDTIKQKLLKAPALRLPDISKPFLLYVDENKGVAKRVLTPDMGPWRRPVAYLSKKLDSVAAGWPPCLRIIAAAALLVKDADKLTLGQSLVVATPHALDSVLKQPPDRWMSNAGVTHYQALLLNPVHCIRPDLHDTSLTDTEETWFTDGSSFVRDGHSLQTELVLPPEEIDLLESLKALSRVQRDIWPRLRALYSSSSPPEPHSFEPGDWVLIRRHQRKSLEPQ
ncbi:hypothetical protein STEG23_031479 [Scotinomys teguina]